MVEAAVVDAVAERRALDLQQLCRARLVAIAHLQSPTDQIGESEISRTISDLNKPKAVSEYRGGFHFLYPFRTFLAEVYK